jgi:hypothetical protein
MTIILQTDLSLVIRPYHLEQEYWRTHAQFDKLNCCMTLLMCAGFLKKFGSWTLLSTYLVVLLLKAWHARVLWRARTAPVLLDQWRTRILAAERVVRLFASFHMIKGKHRPACSGFSWVAAAVSGASSAESVCLRAWLWRRACAAAARHQRQPHRSAC